LVTWKSLQIFFNEKRW